LPVIQANEITKVFGTATALSGLNLRVMPGEIYGLLGPNGAGKTTMIKIIAGLIEPNSGSVQVLGLDPYEYPIEAKSKIGYVSETTTLYDSLTPREFFEFVSSIRRVDQKHANDRISRFAQAFGLEKFYDSPIATLSMGTKQKISIIAALLHEPPLLLLDEPLNGLDAKTSRIVKDIISLHASKNEGAVLFSTHIMEVAEHVCDRIGIIYQGKIVAEGSLDDLRKKASAITVSSTNNGSSETPTNNSATLEDVFLKLTHEEDEIQGTIKTLREAFFAS